MQRVTKQRTAVAAALATLDDFRSSQELHEYLRDQGESVGLTTVYRTLQAMAELGEVDVIVRDDGEAAYRRCSDDHHHHLVCRSCGATIEITGPTVEEWADAMAAKYGYRDISHTLEIFGLCSDCG
jgi:Fur family transcriptional regulator, ferric uptake regulator